MLLQTQTEYLEVSTGETGGKLLIIFTSDPTRIYSILKDGRKAEKKDKHTNRTSQCK